MENKLIHIVPFDIGSSFFDYEYSKEQNKENFLELLTVRCQKENICLKPEYKNGVICSAYITEKIMCYLLECGVGVFVVQNLQAVELTLIKEKFCDDFACPMYYRKKYEQKEILEQKQEEVIAIMKFMQLTWEVIGRKRREYSSSDNYKHHGLSYVLSIYHIIDNGDGTDYADNKNIDILMNPNLLGDILDQKQWDFIENKIKKHRKKEYQLWDFNGLSQVAASWSAVMVIDEKETDTINRIIDFEVLLQSSWFLYDCLMDNIKKTEMSNLELQKVKSLVTNVALEINNITSANMGTNEKVIMEEIYYTSGINVIEEKLKLLLENRISISEAKIREKQGMYGVVTEILLVMFTLVSIYEPIKSFITGSLEKSDFIVAAIMMVILAISSILIIRKEK